MTTTKERQEFKDEMDKEKEDWERKHPTLAQSNNIPPAWAA